MEVLSAVRAKRRAPVLQLAKTAVAMVAAWLICGWLIPVGPPPVFAAIAALLVVQPSLNQSYLKAIERSAGVIVGVLVASAVALFVPDAVWALVLSIVLGLAVAWAVRMTAGTTNQVAISALLVVAMGQATPDYAFDRVIETIIGAALGFVVNLLLVPPVTIAPAKEAVEALGAEVAATLDRLADALDHTRTPAQLAEMMVTARLMRPMRDAADAAIESARESLTLNPRGGRHRGALDDIVALRDRFSPVVTQVVGMTRALYDRYDDGLAEDPVALGIAEQLRRAAHDVRFFVRRADQAPDAPPTESMPALTRPMRVPKPSADNWILVGSLLEDLRRVHEELTDDDPLP
ncbi:FUSC family protein [Microbacterium halophytorum]|uniref:FUSC family protein n=1 Tax=Microbacterium halophytorum TaxID=2067568 RepID=UPI000CFCAC05|nr:FUSC family protein [Microbacterium halophytorum]